MRLVLSRAKIGSILDSMSSLFSTLGISASISGGVILICWLLFLLTGDSSYYILSLLAITLSAWYGGLKAGATSSIITALAIDYIFLPPHFSLWIQNGSSFLDLLLFIAFG